MRAYGWVAGAVWTLGCLGPGPGPAPSESTGGQGGGHATAPGVGDCVGERSDGRCVRVIANDHARELRYHRGYLYYFSTLTGALVRVPPEGGEPEVVLLPDEADGMRPVFLGDDVFWLDVPVGVSSDGGIRRASLTDRVPLEVLDGVHAQGLAVDARGLYFTGDGLYFLPHGLAEPQLLDELGFAPPMVLAGYVYYIAPTHGLRRVPSGGGDHETLVPEVDLGPVAACGDFVCWVDVRSGELGRWSPTTRQAETLARWPADGTLPATFALSADDRAVYFGTDHWVGFHAFGGGVLEELSFEGEFLAGIEHVGDTLFMVWLEQSGVFALTPVP